MIRLILTYAVFQEPDCMSDICPSTRTFSQLKANHHTLSETYISTSPPRVD